jgi:hypothetical protein
VNNHLNNGKGWSGVNMVHVGASGKGNTKIIERKTHASLKQFNISHMKQLTIYKNKIK